MNISSTNNVDKTEAIARDIQQQVEQINHKTGGSWRSLWYGFLGGLGSVIGAFLAILVIGWVLNIVGVIPAFKTQAELWRQTLQQSKK